MNNPEATEWPNFRSFTSSGPRRASSFRLPLGPAWETVRGPAVEGPVFNEEEWELLWLPATGEVIQRRVTWPHPVRLLGWIPHRDYLDDVLQDNGAGDGDTRHRRRGRNWRREAIVVQLQRWQALFSKPSDHTDPDDQLADYNHTRSQLDQTDWGDEIWDDLDGFVDQLAHHAAAFHAELRSNFNLADAANNAMELACNFDALRSTLVEAYTVAHQRYPGRQIARPGPDTTPWPTSPGA